MWKTTCKLMAALLVCGGCCCDSGADEIIEEDIVVVAPVKGKMAAGKSDAKKKNAMKCTSDQIAAHAAAHNAVKPLSKAAGPVSPQCVEARKCAQTLVDSICKNDGKKFCSQLPAEMKKKFTPQHFAAHRKAVCDRLGKPVKGEFLAELAHPVFNVSVWKVTFIKQEPGKPPVEQQALFQVVTGERNGKMQLMSFGFL